MSEGSGTSFACSTMCLTHQNREWHTDIPKGGLLLLVLASAGAFCGFASSHLSCMSSSISQATDTTERVCFHVHKDCLHLIMEYDNGGVKPSTITGFLIHLRKYLGIITT